MYFDKTKLRISYELFWKQLTNKLLIAEIKCFLN